MKKPLAVLLCIIAMLYTKVAFNQSFGTFASAVWISDCNQSNFFNTSGASADEFGPSSNIFNNANLGVHTQNSGTLILRGAAVKTSKTPGSANVCSSRLNYRIYLQSGSPGAFNIIDLPHYSDCNTGSGLFPGGGPCQDGDQVWQRVIGDGTIAPYPPVNLTGYAPGNYVLEVYYDVTGSNSSSSGCTDQLILDNSGNYYKAFFSIQSPTFASNNPVTCNGNEGYITISGLVAGANYNVSYTDDGVPVGPLSLTANGSGQVIISNLNAGLYSNFSLQINGCTTNLFIGVVLSNPIFIPTFSSIPPFCEGTTPPNLPGTSGNGISGTWSPAAINNTTSGNYTFTPAAGQCGIPVTISITVIPRVTPTFSFGTSLNICNGGVVPSLPNTSNNGINGTWNPTVVDNTNSGTYTFTPNAGQCANPATFTVTVNPNITPAFSFGTSLTICAGDAVPTLSSPSINGITGTWSPSIVDNLNSGSYTFTPDPGQCAIAASFTVTVNPVVNPIFSFGSSMNICAGGIVPTLPGTSNNGVTGTWNPAVVDNMNSGTYTFTPDPGQCATLTTFSVTINPNITPTFSFGTSLNICAGGSVPTLPNSSTNGITGSWNPAIVDDQNSGTYTFTPDAGQCAITTTFTVTVAPNITPTFSFGTSMNICSGDAVPTLPTTSTNGITGIWSPSVIDNTSSGSYTFTPSAGQCALTTSLTVTVNPIVTPVFGFGNSLNICAGGSVPTLPGTSTNGITGTWNPTIVDPQNSGTYTFNPDAGQCATTATFTVTVTPNITPSFAFGTSLTICTGGSVPTLPTTSNNGITGIWSPAIVDDQNSGVYTFTPDAGQCAISTTFTVTVNPILTPTFGFGNSLDICAGTSVPSLPAISTNGITGSWNPAAIDNQNSGTYTFTPDAGQCATSTTLTVNVSPVVIPVFSIGSSLAICPGGVVPSLPLVSDNGITGTWSPSVVDNMNSGIYTFTPDAGQGSCIANASYTVTVNPIVTPAFSFGSMSICIGASVPSLPAVSSNGINGTWSPASIDNQNSGAYTFTPNAGECANPLTIDVTVNNIPTVTVRGDTTINDGDLMPATFFTGTPATVNYNWTNSNPGIGLTEFGTGNVPAFIAVNRGSSPEVAIINVVPMNGGCAGAARNYKITVNPLNKDIFVPNVFSPNGDGKNDKLFAYGNYVDKIEMRIFNQWGEQVIFINSLSQGWDGTFKGKPQPVGVYVYVLKATMSDGRVIQMKGSITLLR